MLSDSGHTEITFPVNCRNSSPYTSILCLNIHSLIKLEKHNLPEFKEIMNCSCRMS